MQPADGSQRLVVQGLPSSGQTSGPLATQAPAKQASAPLQTFPSAQAVPSATLTDAQMPVAGWQTLAVQRLPSLSVAHTTACPAMQLPLLQVCPSHRSSSGHAVPFARGV